MVLLTSDEYAHYQRQLKLQGFGEASQLKLKAARVLVVGAGGLGSPVLLYLAAAGVGKIGIVDNDRVELSNLHRQVIFSTEDVGAFKVLAAKKKLERLNPYIQIESYTTYLNKDNALEIANKYDVIVDGTDNFPTRYLVNDVAVKLGIPNVHASIQHYTGQVSVFNFPFPNGEFGPNYRDIYPQAPNPQDVISCAEGGVLGVLPGIVGAVQAMETLKVVCGIGEPLVGKLWMYDALDQSTQILHFEKDATNKINSSNRNEIQLIDYENFCGIKKEKKMKTIKASELKQKVNAGEDFQLIDVREPSEYQQANMGGTLIPMNQIPQRFEEISRDKMVVVHCHLGGRSANVINYLEQTHQYSNLYNLEGGITAWQQLSE